MERTLIILKPDAVQRGLCGEILARFEKKGLQIVGMKMMKIPYQFTVAYLSLAVLLLLLSLTRASREPMPEHE